MKRDPVVKDDSDSHSSQTARKPRTKRCRTRRRYGESRRDDDTCFVALDCEMVGVGPDGKQSALGRVSIVDFNGRVLLDTFVHVDQPVTDYRTHVSGIVPHDLESESAMDYEPCRQLVARMIHDKIVVGHGLRNDFAVLNIEIPWYKIRDTTKYQDFLKVDPHSLSKIPNKLKVLAQDFLGLAIQREGAEHDSIQDAQVAMLLYKRVQTQWEKIMAFKMQKTANILSQLMA